MILDFFFFFLMCFIPFFFINQNFAVWIALFLSLTNLIPYVGPYIGGIPVVIYEFFIDQHLGYASLIVIMVLQYLESSYLQPYLFSKGIHLHPILLLIALTFFGDLFGLIGMIFSPLLLSYVVFIGELFKNLRIGDDIKRIMQQDVYKRQDIRIYSWTSPSSRPQYQWHCHFWKNDACFAGFK